MKLKEKYPETETQFDTVLNKGISYEDLTVGSTKPVLWRCDKGPDHIWKASPNQRTSGGKLRGCSICAGKKVVYSTSLASRFAEIASEWDYERNEKITPEKITPGSNKLVWWKCPAGPNHVWKASPKKRIQGNTCPVCKSLGYLFPDFAAEWHPIKNESLTPFDIKASSHKELWWKCPAGPDHVWKASPNKRTSLNTGCPICSGYKVVKSNSLAVTHPELSSEWDFKKNGDISPHNVHAGSHKKVWWKCDKADDHQWKAQIKSRASQNLKCLFCSGRRITKSNSLAIKRPDIIKFWHPTKNLPLTVYEVTPYSSIMAWWKCPAGSDHEWKATVANVVGGSTCPVCMNRKITESNNLAILYPDLEKEWDYVQNKGIDPYKISGGSKIKVWWICKRDIEHIWYASIHDRTSKESGCPYCAKKLNISELKMLDIIKGVFPNEKVLYNSRPRWLKRLQIDIYLPKLKLGFEYQGQQHFMPVELFGGKEAFVKQVQRDKLKKKLCDKKGITLLYVYFDEQLDNDLICQKLNNAGITV